MSYIDGKPQHAWLCWLTLEFVLDVGSYNVAYLKIIAKLRG